MLAHEFSFQNNSGEFQMHMGVGWGPGDGHRQPVARPLTLTGYPEEGIQGGDVLAGPPEVFQVWLCGLLSTVRGEGGNQRGLDSELITVRLGGQWRGRGRGGKGERWDGGGVGRKRVSMFNLSPQGSSWASV